jgi:zinc D-Ala-D-Ala carboxypeptidase
LYNNFKELIMRVLEPHHFKYHVKERSRWPAVVLVLLLLAAAGGGGYWYWNREENARTERAKTALEVQSQVVVAPSTLKTTPKVFSGSQFKDLYRSVLPTYPNTEAFPEAPLITGNIEADKRIRTIAERRGFQLTRIPVTALVKTDEPRLRGQADDLLQPLAYQAWLDIKKAAKDDNVPLSLMSAYRSPEWQRALFMERLLAKGVSVEQIAAGYSDAAIESTLTVTAIPGYSRHHAGYTVDFWCEDGSGVFANSTCFRWLNETNYINAKRFGWIPSYPDGADAQGPEPEPWEYVWVGKDFLYQ